MKSISTCLWFDNKAEEAAKFYTELFGGQLGRVSHYTEASAKQAKRPVGSVMTIDFTIANMKVMGLNGGPLFKFSPSFSFYVSCNSINEINTLWSQLSANGTIRMALDKYPWAEKYGWTSDRFGVEWQIILSTDSTKISPSFLFTDSLFGKGREAIDFYTNIFPNSEIKMTALYPKTGSIAHCEFTLNGQLFNLMEGEGQHGHAFNESMSLVVSCETQEEIDGLWTRLTSDGGKPIQCGWLKDKFGVSWQIVPSNLDEYANDPIKHGKAMKAVMEMVKLDMVKIDRAANG